MTFVYLHILWFGCWIGFGVEDYPFGLLTMIVSLEAIFLSTFVMISQNRADGGARSSPIRRGGWCRRRTGRTRNCSTSPEQILRLTQEVRAYGDTVQEERDQNKELLDVSRQTLALTREVHSLSGATAPAALGSPKQPDQPEGGSAR